MVQQMLSIFQRFTSPCGQKPMELSKFYYQTGWHAFVNCFPSHFCTMYSIFPLVTMVILSTVQSSVVTVFLSRAGYLRGCFVCASEAKEG